MTKPELTSFSSITPLIIQQYEKYLPTAFDDSLTHLEKMNKIMDTLNQIGILSNSVTAKWNEVNEWLLNEGISDEVDQHFQKYVDDGTFEGLINGSILADLQTQVSQKVSIEQVRQSTTSFPIEYSELGQSVKTAITGGSVAVVGNMGVDKEQIKTGSVSPRAVSFFKQVSKNIIDERTIRTGGYYSPSGGDFRVDATLKASELIATNTGEIFKGNYSTLAIYGDTLNVLVVPSPVNGTHTMPTGAKFARFNFVASEIYPKVFKVSHNGNNQPTPYYEKMKYTDENFVLGKQNIGIDFEITERNTSFFKKVRTVNLFDKDKVVLGRWDKLGVYGNLENTVSSDLIGATDGERFRSNTSGHITFYDESFNLVNGLDPTNYFDVPLGQGIRYFRKAVLKGNEGSEMIVKGDVLPTSYVPYYEYILDYNPATNMLKGISKLNGLKLGTLGTSITDSAWGGIKKYDTVLAEKYGMTLTNYGVGGTKVAKEAGRSDSFVERYLSMRADLDIILVEGGQNDISGGLPVGVMTDRIDTTFYGAMHVLCEGLLSKYAGKAIGFMTPTLTVSPSRPRAKHEQYANIIKEVCGYYSIPVLDMTFAGGLNPSIQVVRDQYFFDETHPNAKGQEMIAKRVHGFLESLVF
jgi:lysophospholipase L1-like esterase